MDIFEDYLATIVESEQQEKMKQLLTWIHENYPELETRIAWKQPMFVNQGTYIIGFSYSKEHIAMAPENEAIENFKHIIEETGLTYTKNIIRIRWEETIPYDLIKELIEYNIQDKKGYNKFWR